MMNKKIIVFVYGSLKKGYYNHHYLSGSKYLGEAILNDYGLIDLGRYPGIIAQKGCDVEGELYEINAETKAKIDELEEEGSLYACVSLDVRMNHQMVKANVYLYLLEDGIPIFQQTKW